jgi:hypothetical protein
MDAAAQARLLPAAVDLRKPRALWRCLRQASYDVCIRSAAAWNRYADPARGTASLWRQTSPRIEKRDNGQHATMIV